MEATILFVAVTTLILLAVTSMRYGVDSREGFGSKDGELAGRENARSGSSTMRNRLKPSVARLALPRKCVSASCGA